MFRTSSLFSYYAYTTNYEMGEYRAAEFDLLLQLQDSQQVWPALLQAIRDWACRINR